jgi:hypothetical protein
MARTPLELPDAPTAGTSAGAAADADDLLSQLAGNEIDRLLQEAESSVAEAAPLPPSGPTVQASAVKVSSEPEDLQTSAEPALGAQIDNLLAEIQNPPPEPDPVAPIAAEPAVESVAADAETSPDAAERSALLEAAGFSKPADGAENKLAVTEGVLEEPPVGKERSALLEAAGFEAPDGTPISPMPDDSGHSDDALQPPLPKYLQPLVWINSPLVSRPPIVRQLIGGAAIVTLVNALAVIGYVLLFKKH